MWRELREDVQALQAYRCPGLPLTRRAALRLWLTSRGLWLLAAQRLCHHAEQWSPAGRSGRVLRFMVKAAGWFAGRATLVAAKSDILARTRFAGGVVLSDRGHIVLGARSVGRGSVIQHHVTVGIDLLRAKLPEIGDDVWIGPYCVAYGNIRIGDGATILPHSVLSRSVPPGCIVQGNPAVLLQPQPDRQTARLAACKSEDPERMLPDIAPDATST